VVYGPAAPRPGLLFPLISRHCPQGGDLVCPNRRSLFQRPFSRGGINAMPKHVQVALLAAAMLFACCAAGIARADAILLSATAGSGSMSTFGPAVSGTLASGYSNSFGSQVTGSPIVSGTNGGAQLNTFATVSHALGSDRVITMSWRTRTLNESYPWEPGGNPTQPPMDIANLDFGLASDVVDMTGFAQGEKFVMQMSYVDTLFNEAVESSLGCVHINWLDPVSGLWRNAVYGNTATEQGAVTNYQGSWAAAGSPTTLGSWGIDTTNNVVWAVLDHNSEFAVVPEPSSMLLLAAGALASLVRRKNAK
jgi:hypothetical protein